MAKKTKNKVGEKRVSVIQHQNTDAEIYYNFNNIRSYNALINFILTGRGNRKDVWSKVNRNKGLDKE